MSRATLFLTKKSAVSCAFVWILLTATGCNRAETTQPIADGACNFRSGGVVGPYCRVSIFSLIVDPYKYSGRRVFTHGFLQVGAPGNYLLAPSPAVFQTTDLISCVRIIAIEKGSALIDREGMYAVTIAGELEATDPNDAICAAEMPSAVILGARRVGD